MKIFNYHPETHEYTGDSQADASPLEPDVFLMPSYSTPIEPPATLEIEVAVFIDGQWLVKPDWRGVALFGTADGASVFINDIGVVPSDIGATDIPPPDETFVWRKGKWVVDKDKVAAKLEIEKSRAITDASTYIHEVRKKIAGTSDQIEIAAWSNKLRIATAIHARTASTEEIYALQAEIELRGLGETLDLFCQKIFANASAYSMACCVLDGIKRSTNDLVVASTTSDAINVAISSMKSEIAQKLGV